LIAESVSKEALGQAVGLVTSSFFIARVFMPSEAAVMADTIDYRPTFLIGGMIVIAGTMIFWIYGRETYRGKRGGMSIKGILGALKPRKKLNWIYITTFMDRLGWTLWFPLLNAYIGKEFGLSATEVGLLNSLMFTTTLLTQYLIGRWIDRVGYFRGLILSELSGFLSALTLGVTGSITFLVVGMIFSGLSVSLWIPSYNKAVSLNSKKKYRALEFSKINMYRAIAAIPAPYIGGYLYDYIAPSIPFTLSSIIFLITTSMFYIISRRHRETSTET
jgi:predicted MFS family arabinose efflux permease